MEKLAPRDLSAIHTAIDELFSRCRALGDRRYGEDVTFLAHAEQCADLARRDSADDALVLAALLHDVGWLETSENDDEIVPDDDHAAIGARTLAPLFGPDVAQPVALHVMAKRWRCTVDPDYFDELSNASQISFIAQGGPLSTDERARFESMPGFVAAMALRAWDDRAKVAGLVVVPLEDYLALAHDVATRYAASRRAS